MKYQVKTGDDLPEEFEGWLWEEAKLLPRGEMSMLIGHDGEGKTSIALERVAQWTRNEELVYISMLEDGPEMIKAKLQAYEADLDMVVVQPDRADGTLDASWMIPDDLDKIEAYLAATGATVAVFDSLDAHLSHSPISHKARLALAATHAMAQRLGIAVIFLHHFNKGGKQTSIDQAIGGARGIKAAMRTILVWGAPFAGVEFEGSGEGPTPTHALAVHKNSFGPAWPHRPSLVYAASEIPNPFWEDETVLSFTQVDSTPMISPSDIYMARHRKKEDEVKQAYVTSRDVAADAITALLTEHGDWMPATELEERAMAAGACQRTVKGTRATMARHGIIEKKKDGEAWYWRLTERGQEHVSNLAELQAAA
jgi:hypothetical protein